MNKDREFRYFFVFHFQIHLMSFNIFTALYINNTFLMNDIFVMCFTTCHCIKAEDVNLNNAEEMKTNVIKTRWS